jgi:hypothetical protein
MPLLLHDYTSQIRCLTILMLGVSSCSLWAVPSKRCEKPTRPAASVEWRDRSGWKTVSSVSLDSSSPEKLSEKSGRGVLLSHGDALNLESCKEYQDVDVQLEFMIPKGSNAGVKLLGRYEIQILDTHGATELSGDSCGGIYPRAEEEPDYHHIDGGVPPRVNAAKPAGEWQSLEIQFVAPRFNAAGKKTSNARFVRVVLNGKLIHENVEVAAPTGAAWRLVKEVPRGPLLLQGDLGPVAFRNVQVRPRD